MSSYWHVGGANALPGTEAVLPCNAIKPEAVIAPASILPQDVEEVPIVMDVSASTFPWNRANVPIVAELPTCQKTLEALAPPIKTIELPGAPGAPAAVVSVEGAWKMKRAFESPWPSRVRTPVTPIVEAVAEI